MSKPHDPAQRVEVDRRIVKLMLRCQQLFNQGARSIVIEHSDQDRIVTIDDQDPTTWQPTLKDPR
jgi:hypothetical protein